MFGGPAAAAAAGALYGLDAAGFEDALGLAATQACGLMAAQFESMGKRMQHGFAARAHGLTGGRRSRLRRLYRASRASSSASTAVGFLGTFGEGHHPDASRRSAPGLGERCGRSATDRAQAVCRDGADCTRRSTPPARCWPRVRSSPEEVDRVEIFVSEPAFEHGGWRAERPLAAVGAQMNLAYAVAVTLLDGTALAAQFSPARIDADDVWGLIEQTTLRHEPAFDERFEDGYNTHLEMVLQDHATRTSLHRPAARWAAQARSANEEVVEKFRTLAEPLIDDARAREMSCSWRSRRELPAISDLVALLAAAVHPIFAARRCPHEHEGNATARAARRRRVDRRARRVRRRLRRARLKSRIHAAYMTGPRVASAYGLPDIGLATPTEMADRARVLSGLLKFR